MSQAAPLFFRRSFRVTRVALLAAAAAAAAACAAGRPVRADPLFSDSFNYPPGALAGNGPPPGSPAGQAGWTNFSGGAQVTAGGLAYANWTPDAAKATVAGLGARLGDDVIANFGPVGGAAGGVVWVGFLVNQAGGETAPAGFAVVNVGPRSNPNDGIGIGMLFNQDVYGIDNNLLTPVERAQTTVRCDGTVTWVVAKLNFDAGTESVFVNPPAGSEPPDAAANASQAMTAAFRTEGIGEVLLAAGGNTATFNFGALRVGATFADVTPAAAAAGPSVALVQPAATPNKKGVLRAVVSGARVVFKGTAAGGTGGLKKVRVSLAGYGSQKAKGTDVWKAAFANVPPGVYQVSVTATDNAGHTSAPAALKLVVH